MKQWVYQNNDKIKAAELARECGIDSFTALLLMSKGISDPFSIDEFLSDDILIQDPNLFIDLLKGAQRINRAIENNELIAVFGDYDCDGITSTALLYSVLKELGAKVLYRLPSRDEGYGMSVKAVDEFNEKGVNLIITVDNGITAFEAIDRANEFNIDVIVTDHHLPSDILPDAYAVIDPKRSDCSTEFKDYAGVGVAFMLCSVISETPPEDLIYAYGDLVAIGTVADVMPLVCDNRTFVKYGLKLIKKRPRIGVKALINAAGIKLNELTSTNIAFGIAPRINASGRVMNPEKALELLICENEYDASSLADELCEANSKRQKLEKEMLSQAIDIVNSDEKLQNAPVLVVGGNDWHHGVIGIVAAKLCTIFSKPTVVFSFDNKNATGSARGYEGISIYDILAENSECAESFGGHSGAAGITVKLENFEKFKNAVQYSAKKLYPDMPFERLEITCKLNPSALSINNVYAQNVLQPFGEKNSQPVFALCNMTIADIKELSGNKHLKLILYRDKSPENFIEVMKFFTSSDEFVFKKGDKINIAVTIDSSVYMQNEKLTIIAKDIKPADINIDDNLSRIRDYGRFKYFGEVCDCNKISREDAVLIYKKIKQYKSLNLDEMSLMFIFKTSDFFKLKITLDILKELEFITVEYDGKYKINLVENAAHKNLNESQLFNLFGAKE